ncbi:MAG: DNA cytosine methyltransferase [Scytonema sp. CRU_2_7]|nr:DNA cytosine methyltransferase [Scytonema sp. CRU_2_7]
MNNEMGKIKHLSLFSGIGGFEEGIRIAGGNITTAQFVEINPDAQAVLRSHYPTVPIHADIKDFSPRTGEFDLYTIGFPCTGTSAAGNGTGLNHPESSLWFEALRCIADGKPNFTIIENPAGIISRGLRAILGGLRICRYCWDDPQIVSAEELGAPHERKRLFIVAYPDYLRQRFNREPTSWSNQIRAVIEEIYSQGGQAAPSRTGVDDGIPPWLGGRNINGWWASNAHTAPFYPGMRHHTAKRREANDLYARSVCPLQAAIAIRRVLYLNSLLKAPA